MRYVHVENVTRRSVLAERAGVADTYWLRLRGLLGRPQLGPGDGLLITPCRAVHTFGMSYAIDLAFVDVGGQVVGVNPALRPWAKSGWNRLAKHVLELPAGTLAETGTCVGDSLSVAAVQSPREP